MTPKRQQHIASSVLELHLALPIFWKACSWMKVMKVFSNLGNSQKSLLCELITIDGLVRLKSCIGSVQILWIGLFSRGLIFTHFHFIRGILKFAHYEFLWVETPFNNYSSRAMKAKPPLLQHTSLVCFHDCYYTYKRCHYAREIRNAWI